MKKTLLAIAAVSALAFGGAAAQAGGVGGAVTIGAQSTTFQSQISGNVSAIGNGQSTSAAETDGFGKSTQIGSATGGSTAQIGSNVGLNGVTVGANTVNWSTASTEGHVEGNSPINVGDSIANGSAALGNGKAAAGIGGTFNQVANGAQIGVDGSFQVDRIGN